MWKTVFYRDIVRIWKCWRENKTTSGALKLLEKNANRSFLLKSPRSWPARLVSLQSRFRMKTFGCSARCAVWLRCSNSTSESNVSVNKLTFHVCIPQVATYTPRPDSQQAKVEFAKVDASLQLPGIFRHWKLPLTNLSLNIIENESKRLKPLWANS